METEFESIDNELRKIRTDFNKQKRKNQCFEEELKVFLLFSSIFSGFIHKKIKKSFEEENKSILERKNNEIQRLEEKLKKFDNEFSQIRLDLERF